VFNPASGWRTDRLVLEPVTAGSADDLFEVLNDPELHHFVGGEPLSHSELTSRYARLSFRRSPDGTQVWANWLIRDAETGEAAGTLQATLPAAGPLAGAAELGWVVGRAWQGLGIASEAAAGLANRLTADGWDVIAHVHPDHVASARVAAAAGLSPTAAIHEGEVRWLRQAPARDATAQLAPSPGSTGPG
jgi:RimJ/RimL family protein N-acetyltransferase